jgi:hypothetical protein
MLPNPAVLVLQSTAPLVEADTVAAVKSLAELKSSQLSFLVSNQRDKTFYRTEMLASPDPANE